MNATKEAAGQMLAAVGLTLRHQDCGSLTNPRSRYTGHMKQVWTGPYGGLFRQHLGNVPPWLPKTCLKEDMKGKTDWDQEYRMWPNKKWAPMAKFTNLGQESGKAQIAVLNMGER